MKKLVNKLQKRNSNKNPKRRGFPRTVPRGIGFATMKGNRRIGNPRARGPITTSLTPATMTQQFDSSVLSYYRALLDPEYACVNNVEVKFPSPLNLPTHTLAVKNSWNLTPNSSGKVLLSWRPNMLTTVDWAQNLVIPWITEKVKAGNPHTANFYYDDMFASQLTVNNDNLMTGEAPTTVNTNQFLPLRNFNIPIKKYRLVSAKLSIKYNGKLIDEAGTIISGHYVGELAPTNVITTTGNYQRGLQDTNCYCDAKIDFNVYDNSPEMAQFGQFDHIVTLPYGQRETIKKGQNYNFYYYPMDPSTKIFQNVGGYGLNSDAEMYLNWDGTTGTFSCFSALRASDDIRVQHEVTSTHSVPSSLKVYDVEVEAEERPSVTVPTYIIALTNMTPSESDVIEVNLWENYEILASQDVNMLAQNSTAPTLNPTMAQEVQGNMMQQLARKVTANITPKTVANALKTAVDVVGNVAPMIGGRLGAAATLGKKAFSALGRYI